MGNASWADPFATCYQGHETDSRPDNGRAMDRLHFAPPLGFGNRYSLEHEERQVQEALLRSCADRQPGYRTTSDSALQEALLASMQPAEPIPEEYSEAARLLEGFLADLGLKRLDVGSTNMSEGG